METNNSIITGNFIIYCDNWQSTVSFYRDLLALEINYENDWFVEFILTDSARLSVANANRASIDSSAGQGITIALQVLDLAQRHQMFTDQVIEITPIKEHAWGAQVFYLKDPEGNRIEFWQSNTA